MTPRPPASDARRLPLSDVVGFGAVVAVVEVAEPATAAELASVLGDNGIDALEITLRTPGAFEAIERAARTDALPIGAGTVLRTIDAELAVDAGASFLVSPGYDSALVHSDIAKSIAFVPGVLTPSEVQVARTAGFRELKLFPAEQFGGLQLIRSLGAAFGDVAFMPTGGVDHSLALDYLAHPQVCAVGGTWIAPGELIVDRNWTEIGRRAAAIRRSITAASD